MFSGSGFGGALKNLGSKAEQLLEKKKHDVEDVASEKKVAASALLEEQAKKTGDLVWSTKADLEKAAIGGLLDAQTSAVGGAADAKHSAIDALDEEFGKAEKAVDSTIDQASAVVDAKLHEADQFVDEKRAQVGKVVEDTTHKVKETKDDAATSLFGKAKGFLNF